MNFLKDKWQYLGNLLVDWRRKPIVRKVWDIIQLLIYLAAFGFGLVYITLDYGAFRDLIWRSLGVVGLVAIVLTALLDEPEDAVREITVLGAAISLTIVFAAYAGIFGIAAFGLLAWINGWQLGLQQSVWSYIAALFGAIGKFISERRGRVAKGDAVADEQNESE